MGDDGVGEGEVDAAVEQGGKEESGESNGPTEEEIMALLSPEWKRVYECGNSVSEEDILVFNTMAIVPSKIKIVLKCMGMLLGLVGGSDEEAVIAAARKVIKEPFFVKLLKETKEVFVTMDVLNNVREELKSTSEEDIKRLSKVAFAVHTWCVAILSSNHGI
eukprot:m.139020 g.139020  ORF g.139020 m.139020 type:complete len:162 (-) comp13163_c1_seq1:650-1135(-)